MIRDAAEHARSQNGNLTLQSSGHPFQTSHPRAEVFEWRLDVVQMAPWYCATSAAACGAAKHGCPCDTFISQVPGVMRTCAESPRAVLPSSAASARAQQQMLTPLVTSVSARQQNLRSNSVSRSLHDAGSAGWHTQGRSLSSRSSSMRSVHRGAAVVAAATGGSEASALAAGGVATAAATLQSGTSEGEPPQSPGTSFCSRL